MIDNMLIGFRQHNDKLEFCALARERHRFPRGWCSAQRIKIQMIAGGNHTIIYSCRAKRD